MAYGQLAVYAFPFFFWCLSFAGIATTSYFYVASLIVAAIFGKYIATTTVIYQFKTVIDFSTNGLLEKSEIWWTFGVYTMAELLFSYIEEHYFLDSVMYLLAANIKDWCEDHPGVCEDYSVLDMN